MPPTIGFPVFLVLTLLVLGAVVWTGLRRRLRAHLLLVASAVTCLGLTIFYAEKLGDLYDLRSAGRITPIHLFLAKVATLAYLLPIGTGIATLRDRRHRHLHFKSAMAVLALTLITAVTGTAMIWMSTPIPRSAAQLQHDPGQEDQHAVGEDRDSREQ